MGWLCPLRPRWIKAVCVFRCNLPSALLAEWPGSFTCHCGDTGVERIPNKSQHTKLTLEREKKKKTLSLLLPGFELATFRSRVRRSKQQAIPTIVLNYFWLVGSKGSSWSRGDTTHFCIDKMSWGGTGRIRYRSCHLWRQSRMRPGGNPDDFPREGNPEDFRAILWYWITYSNSSQVVEKPLGRSCNVLMALLFYEWILILVCWSWHHMNL